MHQQILLIDDAKPIHALVRALLAPVRVDVQYANDAGYGLVLAASIRPDLILLDVDMPNMNGFEACKKLKADRATADIPIIFLTSMSNIEEKVRGLELGAVDYVTKPFNQAELLARVRASLHTSRLIRLLQEKALIDPLTGLGNRAMFEKRMAAEVALRVRFQHALACVVLDVDDFKTINDTFGQPFGDEALHKIGEVIAEICRTEDMACRHGGDEFVVIAPHTTAAASAVLAERMRAEINKIRFPRQGESLQMTCSFGVADSLNPYDTSMFQRADEAMYRSKKAGRNRVSVATAEVQERAAAA